MMEMTIFSWGGIKDLRFLVFSKKLRDRSGCCLVTNERYKSIYYKKIYGAKLDLEAEYSASYMLCSLLISNTVGDVLHL